MTKDKKMICLYIDPNMWRKFRQKAIEFDLSYSLYFEELVKKDLKNS